MMRHAVRQFVEHLVERLAMQRVGIASVPSMSNSSARPVTCDIPNDSSSSGRTRRREKLVRHTDKRFARLGCDTTCKSEKQETMTINRRELARLGPCPDRSRRGSCPRRYIGPRGGCEKVAAFRLAQIAANPEALGAFARTN
jgi:hypothetical protein